MIRIGAMVSGGGTNLQAVLDAIDAGKIDGQVVTVVSSKEGAYAMERAAKHNIPSVVIPPFSFWISISYFSSSYHTFPTQTKKPDKNLHFYPVPVLFQQLHQLFKKAF